MAQGRARTRRCASGRAREERAATSSGTQAGGASAPTGVRSRRSRQILQDGLEGAAAPPHAPSRLARSEMSSCGVCACWAAPKRPLRAMVAQPATCHVAGTCGTCDAGGRAMSARCSRARVSQRRQRLRCQGLAGSVCSWWARAFGACVQPAPRAGSGSLLTAAFLAVHCRPSLLLHACKRVERASGSTHMQPGQWRVFLHSLCACRGGQRRRQRCFCRASPG